MVSVERSSRFVAPLLMKTNHCDSWRHRHVGDRWHHHEKTKLTMVFALSGEKERENFRRGSHGCKPD
jgi:hypothetical protein